MPTQTDFEADAELVERTLAGDERAAAMLVRRHKQAVRRVFVRAIAEPDTVDDLVQETLASGFGRLATLDRPASFRAWLLRIARHKLHDHFRARARGRAVVVEQLREHPCEKSRAAISEIEFRDEARLLAAALGRLSPRSQLLMLHYYWHELPRTQIAAALGIPVGTVGSRLSYARKQLGELLSSLEASGDRLADAQPVEGRETELRRAGRDVI